VVGASVGPEENITYGDRFRELKAAERVVGHACGSAYRGESQFARTLLEQNKRMGRQVRGKGMIGASPIADQVTALGPLLHVNHAHRQRG